MTEIETLPAKVGEAVEFKREEIDLIKRTVAQGTSDDELKLFLYTAKRTGLDPLLKQIHAVKRWSTAANREVMAIQTGIDGYRLIAERTGKYAPGKEPSYVYDNEGRVISATAFVKKLAAGEWHEVGATAHFSEYVQKTKDGKVNVMWSKMPHVMIAKCAEALALRRAFPAEMSGVYTFEEMGQAGNDTTSTTSTKPAGPKEVDKEPGENQEPQGSGEGSEFVTDKQRKRFYAIWKAAKKDSAEVATYLRKKIGTSDDRKIPVRLYEEICTWAQSGDAQEPGE